MTADSRIRRALRHLVIFGLLGVTMSYTVAWGCMIALYRKDAYWWFSEAFSEAHMTHWFATPAYLTQERTGATSLYWLEHRAAQKHFHPAWAQPLVEDDASTDTLYIIQGIPARCLRCSLHRFEIADMEPPTLEVRGGIFPRLGTTEVLLAYDPYWPGLLLNTAFYGAMLWMLWFAPGMIRRGVRRQRGLCVKCGYDRRGSAPASACPECGGASR